MRATERIADPLDRLEAAILQSARYRRLCPDVIRRIGAQELAKRRTWKEAEQETRNRLHQVGGAYLESRPPYGQWLEVLRAAPDPSVYRAELARMMRCHASTCERLPYLDAFYARTLASIRPIRSVIDVACGFNALALPWMDVEDGGSYAGYDLYSDMMEFEAAAMSASPFSPRCDVLTAVRDVAASPPNGGADAALVLKFLPLLDRSDASGMLDWLRRLNTRYALVSFPTRILGGRSIGMAYTYGGRFREVLEQAGWSAERFDFGNELCFLVELHRTEDSQDACRTGA